MFPWYQSSGPLGVRQVQERFASMLREGEPGGFDVDSSSSLYGGSALNSLIQAAALMQSSKTDFGGIPFGDLRTQDSLADWLESKALEDRQTRWFQSRLLEQQLAVLNQLAQLKMAQSEQAAAFPSDVSPLLSFGAIPQTPFQRSELFEEGSNAKKIFLYHQVQQLLAKQQQQQQQQESDASLSAEQQAPCPSFQVHSKSESKFVRTPLTSFDSPHSTELSPLTPCSIPGMDPGQLEMVPSPIRSDTKQRTTETRDLLPGSPIEPYAKLSMTELTGSNPETRSKKSLTCPHAGCGRQLGSRFSLKRHLERHAGVKPFPCNYPGCNKRFNESNTVKRHYRTHTGEKPFLCEHPGCGKWFTDQSNWRRHERIHTGRKTFQCPIKTCGKMFARSINRKKHLLKVHNLSVAASSATKALYDPSQAN